MRIVVLGYIVRGPVGGHAWHHLQYVLGLRQLGHDVLFLEDSDDFPGCYDPGTFQTTTNPSYGLSFIEELFMAFNMNEQWAYYDSHTDSWFGRTRQKVFEFCNSADVVLNISVVNPLREWWASVPVRILIDTDPAFIQIRHLTDPAAMASAKTHTHFATFGENFGKPFCSIPDDGLPWKPTRQPLFTDAWKVSNKNFSGNWTTVMQWESYKSPEYKGRSFGMKSASFLPYISLPEVLTGEKFELALGSPNAPRNQLREKGWIITDPGVPSKTHTSYQNYIYSSKGEWTAAKEGYVITKSGWFSERTINYMACGKPVVVQDTGFTGFIPAGKGVFTFSNLEEAIEGIKKVNKDYQLHCLESRKIAEEFFGYQKVLSELLSMV